MAGELLASLGFSPTEIANLGGDAAVAEIEAQISRNIEESKSEDSPPPATNQLISPATNQLISPATNKFRPTATNQPISPATNQSISFVPEVIEPLSNPNDSQNITVKNKSKIPTSSPKFKIGDWAEGAGGVNPGQIKDVQWMEQEGLYRYQLVTHFGVENWAEGQLSSTPAQNISQAPTWGQVGNSNLSAGGSGGYYKQTQPGVPLGEVVSTTAGAPMDQPQGPLDQFLNNNRMDLGSGGNGMAEGDIRGEGPFSRYMRERGFGTEGGFNAAGEPFMDMGTRAGRFVADRFPELQDLFNLSQDIRTAGNVPQGDQDFPAFLDNIPDRSQRNVVGYNILQNLFNMPSDFAADSGFDFTRAFDPEGQRIGKTQALERMQDLVQMGGALRFGSRGAKFLASRLPQIRDRFEVENPGGTFVNYFRNRYGL
jgi:hypothetical protein